MGFRLRKRIKIAPGVNLNLSKNGISASVGEPGATVNIGKNGARGTVGLPGSGLSYSKKISGKNEKSKTTQESIDYISDQTSPENQIPTHRKVIVIAIFAVIGLIGFSNNQEKPKTNTKIESQHALNKGDEFKYLVTANKLTIRSEPSINSNPVGTLSLNDHISVERINNGWLQISSKNSHGWVSSKYVTRIDN